MIEWIVSSGVLILIVIGLRTLLKGRVGLRLQYAIWGLVLLRLLSPFSIGSTVFSVANFTAPVQSQAADIQPGGPNDEIHFDRPAQPPQEQAGEAPAVDAELSTLPQEEKPYRLGTNWIIWILVAGTVAVAGLFLATNLKFQRSVIASRSTLDIRKNDLDVFASKEVDTPCLFGFWKPAIYVTESVAQNPTVLRHTLEHEATHYRHGDHIWALLRCFCLAIHWYNPLVWWAAILSQRDAEHACDEATILRLGEEERAEYGRTLVDMTCAKRTNVLMTATTMTTGKSGIKERIRLIARKPKTAIYTLVIVILVAAVAVGCTFTGAKREESSDQMPPPVTEPSQATGTDTPTQSTTLPILTEHTQTLPPQESTESTTQPPETEPTKVSVPANPLGITEILSATLEWNGVHTIDRTSSMNSIENMLRRAQEIEDASCPFTSKLTLDTDDGRTLVLYMAADDCATFLYDGVTYSYAELTEDGYTDNAFFYSLFASTLIRDKSKGGIEAALSYMKYLNWFAYSEKCGAEETISLMSRIGQWAAEKPTSERFGQLFIWGRRTDGYVSEGYGHMLAQVYELAPAEFARACLVNATDEDEAYVLMHFMLEWEMATREEVRAKMESQLQQNH